MYAFDLPGHGESALSESSQIAAIAELVHTAIGALITETPLLMGHSWAARWR